MINERGEEFKTYFNSLSNDNFIEKNIILELITSSGIFLNDVRFGDIHPETSIARVLYSLPEKIDYDTFHDLILSNTFLFTKIIEKDLIIPDWDIFNNDISAIFLSCKNHNLGKVADYIPQLAKVSDKFYFI